MTRLTLKLFGRLETLPSKTVETMLEDYLRLLAERMPIASEGNNWFDVDPTKIDQKLFAEERADGREEWTRRIIVEAFKQMRLYPQKYARPFQTTRPEKTWQATLTVKEMMVMANELGDGILDWVWIGLEWAQRISNGEEWNQLCNKADISKYFTLVIWMDGKPRLVGGSSLSDHTLAPTSVDQISIGLDRELYATVPGVMRYKK